MRALLAVLEIWLTLGFLALFTSLLSAKGKRLGDIFAGTFVIQERLPGRSTLAGPLAIPFPRARRLGFDPPPLRADRRHRGDSAADTSAASMS